MLAAFKSIIRKEGNDLNMFNRTWRWAMLMAILAVFIALPASAQSKSVVWNRFDVDITVNKDGTFQVVEKQEIHFIGGPFTFGYRDISTKNTEAITDIRVGDANGDYLESKGGEPGTFYVEDRSGSKYVKWFFEPTADAVRTFTIRYVVHGGLRIYDEGDQLWWKAVYADRPAEVKSSVVTVKVPPPAVIENMDAYYVMADIALLDKQTAKFTAKDPIPPGKPFEVRVQFTHGVVASAVPTWQAQADKEAASSFLDLVGGELVGEETEAVAVPGGAAVAFAAEEELAHLAEAPAAELKPARGLVAEAEIASGQGDGSRKGEKDRLDTLGQRPHPLCFSFSRVHLTLGPCW